MVKESISIIDAASQLGQYKQTLFKIIKRLHLQTTKKRNPLHKNQMISYISMSNFELIKQELSTKAESKTLNYTPKNFQEEQGVFYLIQLEPEHDPGRIKVGFASNMPERLRTHRCSAPFAKVIEKWPCHNRWEKTAIDCVTQSCKKLHTEVFRTEDISAVKNKCDQFFSLMPDIDDLK